MLRFAAAGLVVLASSASAQPSSPISIEVQRSAPQAGALNVIYKATNHGRRTIDIASVKCVLFDTDGQVITVAQSEPANIAPGASDFVETDIDLKGRTLTYDRVDCRPMEVHFK